MGVSSRFFLFFTLINGGKVSHVTFGDGRESMSSIRRFHSLRSFHPRLFTFAPFGDGRIPLMKVQNDGKAFVLSELEMRQNRCEKINCM